MLNRAQLRERASTRVVATKDVETSFGLAVRIKQLNLLERDEFQLAAFGENGKLEKDLMKGNKARLIAMCLVDPEANDSSFADEEMIVAAFTVVEIDELFRACFDFNGLGKDAKEEAAGN